MIKVGSTVRLAELSEEMKHNLRGIGVNYTLTERLLRGEAFEVEYVSDDRVEIKEYRGNSGWIEKEWLTVVGDEIKKLQSESIKL